jgi:hypothetical protein
LALGHRVEEIDTFVVREQAQFRADVQEPSLAPWIILVFGFGGVATAAWSLALVWLVLSLLFGF